MFSQLNDFLTQVEKTAWEMRGLSEEVGGWTQRSARVSQTGWMLTKLVADYRSFAIYSAFLSRKKQAELKDRIHRRNARRFYDTSVQQKGAFLKLGQMLSARPDLLPASWIEQLAGLQDDAPAEPFEHLRPLIEAELGAPIAERFRAFDETPLAAASIGQVHRAVTHDGIEVAVKVQRPGIAELIDHDLAMLELCLEAMKGMLPPTDYATITAEVRARIRAEVDYRAEARAMEETARFFEGAEGVRVPRPIAALCSERVLTATFIEGEKITTVLDASEPAARSRILGLLLEVYLRQILEAGRFQADPHPGNFLVTAAGELVLLDFGCMRELSDDVRRGYRELVQRFVSGDRDGLAALFERLGFQTQSGRPDTLQAFADVLLDSFRKAAAAGTFAWPTREELYGNAKEVMAAATRDPVTRVPAEFVMIGRVFGTLGGLFQHYRPQIDYGRHVLPHLFRQG
jgi:ubiquinone biosynthesis protein